MRPENLPVLFFLAEEWQNCTGGLVSHGHANSQREFSILPVMLEVKKKRLLPLLQFTVANQFEQTGYFSFENFIVSEFCCQKKTEKQLLAPAEMMFL